MSSTDLNTCIRLSDFQSFANETNRIMLTKKWRDLDSPKQGCKIAYPSYSEKMKNFQMSNLWLPLQNLNIWYNIIEDLIF